MRKKSDRLCRIAGLCCAFLFALAPLGAEALSPPPDDLLLFRIEALERALYFREEGLRLEKEGDIPGAMEAYGRSRSIWPYGESAARIGSFRPGQGGLLGRIALLEGLPGAEKSAGDEPPGTDRSDWRSYPDYEKEKKAVEESFASFKEALKEGNIEKAASLVDEGRREVYSALFAHRPEAMPSFAALLDGAEMTFLSDPEEADPGSSSALRTVEYAVDIDGFTFYVRWIKTGGKWTLFDF